MRNRLFIYFLLVVAMMLASCCSGLKKNELSRVAKDWCQSIRASQVIPVYPPMEDVRPGDVSLVTVPSLDQARTYDDKGFLPLDSPYLRLKGLDFDSYYEAFGYQGPWKCGAVPSSVSFPEYSFEVRSGGGLKLAFPVQAVPVGLDFMKTDSASGSIKIGEAFALAAEGAQILDRLEAWADNATIRLRLASMARQNKTLFLRVVTRVYCARRMDVSMVNLESGGLEADVGADKSPSLGQVADNSTTASEYAALLSRLTAATEAAQPGAGISYAQATSRKVRMSETFPKPLVLGYLGFDIPVLKNGDLGAPVMTRNILERQAPIAPATAGTMSRDQRLYTLMRNQFKQGSVGRQTCMGAFISRELPSDPFSRFRNMDDSEHTPDKRETMAFWNAVDAYLSGADAERRERHQDVFLLMEMAEKQCR